MKKRNTDSGFPAITPLIDVVFLLIIFFIVTIKLEASRNEQILPPTTSFAPALQNPGLTIQVDKDGRIFMFGSECSPADLRRALHSRSPASSPVFVEADARTTHTDVRTVLDLCAAAGHAQVSFIGKQE
jgi:biopolymer transport protein ExbD